MPMGDVTKPLGCNYFAMMRVVLVLVLLAACGPGELSRRGDRGPEPPVIVGAAVPVVGDAAVIAFWLGAVDTLPEPSRRAIQKEFRRSNDAIADYLSDTDVAMVTTLSDTVVVEADGERYLVLLSGFDFPFGYLLIDPGYDEEFHTGLTIDEDLEAAIDEYFELADADSLDRRRIAMRASSEERGAKRNTGFALRSSRLPSYAIPALARSVRVLRRSPRRPGPRRLHSRTRD
jgi:hypothetical protein